MPGNALLPAHGGMLITRGLAEWACLLSMDLPFATAQRVLGWMTHDADVISTTQVRALVRSEGASIRHLEVEAIGEALGGGACATATPVLVESGGARRARAWPEDLDEAVETALAHEYPDAPAGISPNDWARVCAARRQEADVGASALARLGPRVGEEEVVAALDEVSVRSPERRRWHMLHTARVETAAGYRYVSGPGEIVVFAVWVLVVAASRGTRRITILADGARWIRHFYEQHLRGQADKEFILDWYHLCKKCREIGSMICRGREEKRRLLKVVLGALWQGRTDEAITALEGQRGQTRNTAKLAELIAYLEARRWAIPDYSERRRSQRFNGSGKVEKANDLLVARRQKNQGMHWSATTSDGLAALQTLVLNRAWDLYWQQHKVLPLVTR